MTIEQFHTQIKMARQTKTITLFFIDWRREINFVTGTDRGKHWLTSLLARADEEYSSEFFPICSVTPAGLVMLHAPENVDGQIYIDDVQVQVDTDGTIKGHADGVPSDALATALQAAVSALEARSLLLQPKELGLL